MSITPPDVLTAQDQQAFQQQGYLVARNLLTVDEVTELREGFMRLHAGAPYDWYRPASAQESADPLKIYPRVMQPHRHDPMALRYLLHPGMLGALAALFGEAPLAAQSMFYFKPPGSRGQALHQDNFYLKVEPGTCIAAWTAVDAARPANGGLMVVPGSQDLAVLCPEEADPQLSFTREFVPPPDGLAQVPVVMEAGDVLFFNGQVIHGSYPNTSDGFRRAFICHYVGSSTVGLGVHYHPLLDAAGRVVSRQVNDGEDPCGNEF